MPGGFLGIDPTVSAEGAKGRWGINDAYEYRLQKSWPGHLDKISFSFHTYAASSSTTLSIPSSVQDGDLAILFDSYSDDRVSTKKSGVTGFTSASGINGQYGGFGATGSRLYSYVYYKVLSSSDANASISGLYDGLVGDRKIIVIFRPSNTSYTPVVRVDAAYEEGAAAVFSSEILTVEQPAYVIGYHFNDGSGSSVPRTIQYPGYINFSNEGQSIYSSGVHYMRYDSTLENLGKVIQYTVEEPSAVYALAQSVVFYGVAG
jgi:hypothetical protein